MKPNDIDNLVVDQTDKGLFEVSRHLFNDEELFELEMKHIFEGNWVYLCHESQVPGANDFFTTRIGRQPVVVMRGEDGKLRGFINACAHRGATLCRTARGNGKFLTCSYHGWTYDSAGKNVDIKDQDSGGYPDAFLQQSHDLTQIARLESYEGFIFGSLNPKVAELVDHLGETRPFIEMLARMGPDGAEIVKGSSTYTYEGNWKMQTENGIDGYHFTTIHLNYVHVQMRRQQLERESSIEDKVKTGIDENSLRGQTGCYDLNNGHALIWSVFPKPENRPLWEYRDEVKARVGELYADWMLNRQRNLLVYPNVNFMEQASSQIRVFQPISHNKTAVQIFCIAPKGESTRSRERRLRQYEDFFNATGMATPDDLSEFEACQRGFEGRLVGWQQGYDRGMSRMIQGPDEEARRLGINPQSSGPDITHETLYYGQYRQWRKQIGQGLQEENT